MIGKASWGVSLNCALFVITAPASCSAELVIHTLVRIRPISIHRRNARNAQEEECRYGVASKRQRGKAAHQPIKSLGNKNNPRRAFSSVATLCDAARAAEDYGTTSRAPPPTRRCKATLNAPGPLTLPLALCSAPATASWKSATTARSRRRPEPSRGFVTLVHFSAQLERFLWDRGFA